MKGHDEDLNDIENIQLKYTGLRLSQTKSKGIYLQGPVKIKVNFRYLYDLEYKKVN